MTISSITAITSNAAQPPAIPAAVAAPTALPEATAGVIDLTALETPASTATPAPPPEPLWNAGDPAHVDIEVAKHEETGYPMYRVVDAESGQTLVEIPPSGVLDLIAEVLQRLEADGRA